MARNVPELLQVMNDMVALEEALAALYLACSEKFPEDGKFWLAICHQEELHARYLAELAALISSHPHEFKFGRQFNAVAITTIMSSVRKLTDEIRQGQSDRKRALVMARDIENSVLEAKYHEIVTSDNVQFRETIDRIMRETTTHKKLLAAKVASNQA